MGAKIKEPVKTAWHRQKKKKKDKNNFFVEGNTQEKPRTKHNTDKKKKFNVFLASSHS